MKVYAMIQSHFFRQFEQYLRDKNIEFSAFYDQLKVDFENWKILGVLYYLSRQFLIVTPKPIYPSTCQGRICRSKDTTYKPLATIIIKEIPKKRQ